VPVPRSFAAASLGYHPGLSQDVDDELPLAVDLDGTLVSTDTLHEGMISSLKAKPHHAMGMRKSRPWAKAALKPVVASHIGFDASLLPYNSDLLAYLRAAKQAGRRIGLFTAAHQSIADCIAAHLGLFDVVRGSEDIPNLSSRAKIAAIRDAFGARFAYAGDAAVDRPIFDAAESVILVGSVERLRAGLSPGKRIEATFPRASAGAKVWVKALRLRHWVKNSLVFVAPLLGQQMASFQAVSQAVLLFLLMGLVASATYMVNDLLDLAADRRHPEKRFRPFAAGRISAQDGLVVASLMISGALVLGLLLPLGALACLGIYLVVTLCYSLALKRMPMIDVIVLAGLFTIRVVAGGFLVTAPVSPWLLTFSMMFFLNLAVVKRYAELERALRSEAEVRSARGYTGRDLPILLTTGIASGISAIVIFTIYLINEQYPRHIYANPDVLWGMVPVLLIWTLRVWHLSVHGQMNEDPVVFALKDRFSLVLGCVVALILAVAWI
jgi:4-hydroxybenzoate polyprenyltransferase